ncbi:MAG: VTT domain-containing protein [Firmicutes bacterium]|nr:VTT domain-containing protein [Bacillota bacterium]
MDEKENLVANEIEDSEVAVTEAVSKNSNSIGVKFVNFWKAVGKYLKKPQTLKLAVTLVILVGVSVGAFFTFRALGMLPGSVYRYEMQPHTYAWVTSEHYGFDIYTRIPGVYEWVRVQTPPRLIHEQQGIVLAGFIFVILYLVAALFLGLVPGTTTAFTVIAFLLFMPPSSMNIRGFMQALLVLSIAKFLSSLTLYYLGRFGGRRLMFWMFGKDKVEKRLNWLSEQGTKVLPWMFLVPMMPNDIVCMICGSAKMKIWMFMLIVFVFRPIESVLIWVYTVLLFGSNWWIGLDIATQVLLINIVIVNIVILIGYHKILLKIFKKTLLGKKYQMVKKDYMVEEEIKITE